MQDDMKMGKKTEKGKGGKREMKGKKREIDHF